MWLEHRIQLLKELHKRLHIFELQNHILSQDGGKLNGFEAHVEVLQLQLINSIVMDGLAEDVHICLIELDLDLLVIVILLEQYPPCCYCFSSKRLYFCLPRCLLHLFIPVIDVLFSQSPLHAQLEWIWEMSREIQHILKGAQLDVFQHELLELRFRKDFQMLEGLVLFVDFFDDL